MTQNGGAGRTGRVWGVDGGNVLRRAAGRIAGRIVVAVALVALVACTPVYRNSGYIPSDEELAQVTVGEDTRETVGVKVGRPSAAGLLNDIGWYYVQSRFKQRGLLPPLEEDRQVVAITFTEEGIVENIERFGLEQGRVVPLSRRVTDTNVKGAGLIAQLFRNIGGLNLGDLLED